MREPGSDSVTLLTCGMVFSTGTILEHRWQLHIVIYRVRSFVLPDIESPTIPLGCGTLTARGRKVSCRYRILDNPLVTSIEVVSASSNQHESGDME